MKPPDEEQADRLAIHELAVHYGLVTQSFDVEPARYVSAIKKKVIWVPCFGCSLCLVSFAFSLTGVLVLFCLVFFSSAFSLFVRFAALPGWVACVQCDSLLAFLLIYFRFVGLLMWFVYVFVCFVSFVCSVACVLTCLLVCLS